MTTIRGVAEAALYVDDLDRAQSFYEKVLGLPTTARFEDSCFLQTGRDSTLILFEREGLKTRVSQIPSHGSEGEGHVALAVAGDEMEAWRTRLQAHGVEIEQEIDWPRGTHSIYFRDPDGNSLELIEASHYPYYWEKLSKEAE